VSQPTPITLQPGATQSCCGTTEASCCAPTTATTSTDDLRAQVRARYADAAGRASEGAQCGSATFYPDDERAELPDAAVRASLGCGNPLRVADLRDGETVLDLGSGGGIDVLLSARRVGATGHVHGLDMTDEMLALARRNATEAGATNVEFHMGHIEAIPLPDATIDVVISNCVINLSADKPAVFAEMFRVLRPGGRIGISDVVAEDRLTPEQRRERGDWVGCIAGALSRREYLDGLTAAGFTEASVEFTGEYADGMHAAIVRAHRP
jgi:arsenite methyltransferase